MSLRRVLVALCKAYGAFAAAHVAFKLFKQIRLLLRARKHLGALPGAAHGFGLGFDFLGVGIMKNMTRYFDFRAEPGLAHPTAPLVTGPGPYVEIFANSPEAIKHMLKDDFSAFTKSDPSEDYAMELLGSFLGHQGIFVIQHGKGTGKARLENAHALWHRQRKTASKIFTKSAFSGLVLQTFVEKGRILRGVLRRAAEKDAPLDFQEVAFHFTFDAMSRILYGREIDTVSGAESDAYANAFDAAHRALTRIYMNYIPVHVLAGKLLPFPFGTLGSSGWSLTMQAVHKFTEDGRVMAKAVDFLRKSTDKIIDDARADPKLPQRRDLLANFLNSGDEYSNEQLRDIMLNIVIAGRDTTACTLSWLMYEFCCNPDVQRKAQEEIDQVLGRGADAQEPSYEACAAGLPFLTGCVYEALRLHPPVPEDFKIATRDSVFQGMLIPEGTKMTFHNYTLGRSPAHYEDPLAFKPTRWVMPDGSSKKLDGFASPFFQAGYRECLGKEAALIEVKALAAMLLQEFSFSIDDNVKPTIGWALMITMAISNSPDRQSSHQLFIRPHLRQSLN